MQSDVHSAWYSGQKIVYFSRLLSAAPDGNMHIPKGESPKEKTKTRRNFAFLFEFDGDQRHIRHVLYNCVASRPSIEGETNEDSKEVKTDTLNLQATPLANGYVKAKTGTNTTDDVYSRLGRKSQSDFSCFRTLFWASSYTSSSARTPMTIIIIDVSVRRS